MSHSYRSEYPAGTEIDNGIKQYFEEFYRISDTPDAHDKYADSFTRNAKLVMIDKKANGRDEILQIRKGMWAAVASRLHSPTKIFPFGPNSNELMLYGTVAYTFKDERKANLEWAAHAVMAEEGGSWKMAFYQVYLDTAAMRNAK